MMKSLISAALSALCLGASATPAPAKSAGPDFSTSAPCPGCNVVLVSFDALQAAHVHALGYPRPLTPTIDGMAQSGITFTQAISPASWTLPAHMSWFTGAYPSRHQVINKYIVSDDGKLTQSNLQNLSPGLRTLAEVLQKNGYTTGGFTGGAGVSGSFGFNKGFDVYWDQGPLFSGMEVTVPKALQWLEGIGKKRFFLFLHGYGFHGQYSPPGGFDKRFVEPPYEGPYDGSPAQQRVLRELGLRHQIELDKEDVQFWRDLYDEKVARTDAIFAGFLSAFRALKLEKQTVFILASDHGTEHYEHKRFDHGHTLYDELVHVLLVVVSPGVKGGRVVHAQVGTLGMMPTILDLIGVEPDQMLQQQLQGRSLLPLLQGRSNEGEDVFVETDYRLYTHKRGLRTKDGWKLIKTMETKASELYDLKSDPGETKDLAAARPDKVKELDTRLMDHYRALGALFDHWTIGCSPVYPDQCH